MPSFFIQKIKIFIKNKTNIKNMCYNISYIGELKEFMRKTICELFAGVGGFRLGFERQSQDWETVWFSQWEPGAKNQWAHQCYVSHWGDIDNNTGIDIAEVNKSEIPNHNLLVGGFPCQDYSVAHSLSSSHGIEGKKGVLWWQIRDILEEKQPPFVLLENVDRLLKSPAKQRGRDFGIILSCFAQLNYSVEWRVVNAAEFGAAQRRRRIFIFAYKNTTNWANNKTNETSHDIILNTGLFARAFPIAENGIIKSEELNFDDLLKVSNEFKYDFKNAGLMLNGNIYTCDVKSQTEESTPLINIIEHNVDEEFYITNNLEKWQYLKGSKKINRTSKDGHAYVFSEGAIAFPDSLDMPARTMLTSESTLNRSTHVIRDVKTNNLRLITPVEAERIQGFDDNWTNTGMPKKMRYFCMGNALVVPMITRMANILENIFNEEN